MGIMFPKVIDHTRRIKIGQQNPQYCKNKVDTTKYNLITFIPKCILYQFLKLSNIVFLVNAVLQSIPAISSLSPITAIAPLGFVLLISLLRQAYQDYKRHLKDWQINTRVTHVLRSGQFVQIDWDQVKVGDFIKVFNNQIIPADLLLLSSSQQNSICYIQTANLDGQSNLKQKFAYVQTVKLYPHQFESLKGHCLVDIPKSNLYQFEGDISIQDTQTHQINYSNLVLRQTVLKNTDQIVGMALYCGYDTKILKNQGQIHHKISQVQKKINYIQVILVFVLVFMCIVSSIGYSIIHNKLNLRSKISYIPLSQSNITIQSTLMFFTIFLMLNFLIPISLNIVIEGIKAFSGVFLSVDKKFYDQHTKKYCSVLNTSIIEQLGIVDCILTDKTGTLTANQMVFKSIAIKDMVMNKDTIKNNLKKLRKDRQFDQFWLNVILCHDVVKDNVKDEFQGSSPDQVCFINFAHDLGYSFVKRAKDYIQVNFQSQKMVFEMIDILPFSNRKRMSVVIGNINNTNQVMILTKGADSCVFDKAVPYQYQKILNHHLDDFAKQGLRTLVFAHRKMSRQKYNELSKQRNNAKNDLKKKTITKQQFMQKQDHFIQQIQDQLTILGATGIQDRLQQDVPQTLERLQKAGIKIMMITGDKLETAENIGYLAKLFKKDDDIYHLSAKIDNVLTKCKQIVYQMEQKHRNIAVIIEGKQISKIIKQKQSQNIQIYCRLLTKAKSVIFCRSSPKQKALIVKFVKDNMKLIVLAIGDGGNDVGMIEQAHIGVGIMGKQGNSASSISDFSFSKFKSLDRLVLHHGRWFYYRFSYFFNFFGWKNVIITFLIFFFLMESAFSGSYNYTQIYYTLYNSLFAIAFIVYLGLYDQDINDDLQPRIWKYLPDLYRHMKKKELFSYKRYFTWFTTGVIIAIIIYVTIRFSVSSIISMDQQGRIADIKIFKIIHGFVLIFIISLIIYADIKTRTVFFYILVVVLTTIIPTFGFVMCQNYLQILGSLSSYEQALQWRILLLILLPISSIQLFQYAYHYYCVQYQPTLVDIYIKAKQQQDLKEDKDIDTIIKGSMKYIQQSISLSKQQSKQKIIENKHSKRQSVKIQIINQMPSKDRQRQKSKQIQLQKVSQIKLNESFVKHDKQRQSNIQIQDMSYMNFKTLSSRMKSSNFYQTYEFNNDNRSFTQTNQQLFIKRDSSSQDFTLMTLAHGDSNFKLLKNRVEQDIPQGQQHQ